MKTNVNEVKDGDTVHVLGYGKGKCIGWVGSPPNLLRIQFDSGNVHDFLPSKLKGLLLE